MNEHEFGDEALRLKKADISVLRLTLHEHAAELAALRAERDELREALEEIANGRYGKSVAVKNIARAVLAKYAGKKE